MGQGVGALKRGVLEPPYKLCLFKFNKGKVYILIFCWVLFFEIDNLEVLDLLLHDQA